MTFDGLGEATTTPRASSDSSSSKNENDNTDESKPQNELIEALDKISKREKLDKKHIEWVSPDGRMKQCYNMSTLIQIACKSTGLRTLKQPPHFRCPMDQKMKMQIENKFPGVVQKIEGAQGGDNEEEEAGGAAEAEAILEERAGKAAAEAAARRSWCSW